MIGYILAGVGVCVGIAGTVIYDIYSGIKFNKSLRENEKALQENTRIREGLSALLDKPELQEQLRNLIQNAKGDLEEKLDKPVE